MFPKLHAEKEAKLHGENGSSLMGGDDKENEGFCDMDFSRLESHYCVIVWVWD